MRLALVLLVLAGSAACSSSVGTGATSTTAVPPAPNAGVTAPAGTPTAAPAPAAATATAPAASPGLAADGKRFAADAAYEGTCAPAGGRGGCYGFTFHPDGRAEHMLLDAHEAGTYRIEGAAIVYRASGPDGKDQRFESTDGLRTLSGSYRYKP